MSSSGSPQRDHHSRRVNYNSKSEHHRRSPPLRANDSRDGHRRRPSPPYTDRHEHHGARRYHDRDFQGHSNRKDETMHGGYRDRDREGYRSPGYSRSRSRSRSPRAPKAGQPAKELILDGLGTDMTEEDIITILKKDYDVATLEEVRVIRDKQTKVSRGFGFIKFSTLEEAEDFVHQYFPTIYLSKDTAHGDNEAGRVRIAYSRERSLNDPPIGGDWTCQNCQFMNFAGRKLCFKCQAKFSQGVQAETKVDFVNNGDSDVSIDGTPSQFLLIRGLEPAVTEELLYKGVAKLFKPGAAAGSAQTQGKKGKVSSTTGDANLGAREGSLRRILLVRDRLTNESWRYGFAEFASLDDAQAAHSRFNSFDKFTISSKPVFVSFIHPGVFVPIFNANEDTEEFTFFPWGNTATRLQYWDENAYVNQLFLADPASSMNEGSKPRSAADEAVLAAQKEGIVAVGDEADAKSKKRKAESKDAAKPKKSAPAHLEFWSNRHAELHGKKPTKPDSTDPGAASIEKSEPSKNGSGAEIIPKSTHVQSYSHPEKYCCYLCSRQFKSSTEANKHERLSDLHRKNLENDELKAQAVAKMKKAGLSIQADDANADTPEYRDRARERRKAFGSSNVAPVKKISLPMKQQPEPTPQPAIKSKGAALLGRMGWNSGEGLGAQGTGMTAPIQTDVYAAGVGLGAEGSKLGDANQEADRNTKGGYAEFVERAKDKAKERYLNMQ